MAIKTTVLVVADTLAEVAEVDASEPVVVCLETQSIRFKNGTWNDVGATGPQGIQGPPGEDGAQGPAGIDGADGATGPQGEPGDASAAWPIGAVFISVVATNPATLLGFGTWAAIGAGRMLVGFDSGDSDFDTAEETGGAKTHTLTTAEMPSHTHVLQRFPTATGGSSGFTADTSMSGTPAAVTLTTQASGGGGSHNNMPPYLVCHFWKRTA